jgi:hypothetical protein
MAASSGLQSQRIDDHNWYFEYPSCLLLVHEVRKSDGTYVQTDTVKIYWRKIEASLARRKPKPKKR